MSKDVADQQGRSGSQPAGGNDQKIATSAPKIAIGDLLREAARVAGDRVALVDGVADPALRRRWTYAELLTDAETVARALLKRFQPGDRIAVCSANCPEWIILQFGVVMAGMIIVPTNPAYREAELASILQDCEASALVHADAWRDNDIKASAAALRSSIIPGLATISFSDWSAFLDSGRDAAPLPTVSPDGPVMIQFTSGTTGRPKGAILHHGLIHPPRHVADWSGFPDYGVWLNAMPLYHIGGSSVSLMATLSRHGAFVLMREWDAALALELIQAERCNGMLLVPTMVVAMLDHPDFDKYDLSSIEFILVGAAPVPPALLERVTRQIGARLMICFGQTEAGGPVCNTAIGDGAHELANTLGRALPDIDIEIRDPETGARLPAGTIGEMWLKGPQIMRGYYGRDEETRATITPEGWLRSGDLATMDERGYVSIAGRLKDMIIRGGMNIYPREIEDVLFEHPSVAQAAVVGVPHEKWGELVLAVIQAADGQTLDFQALHQHCKDRLASFKVPALWCETDSFPLNATGKIQKFVLVDWVKEGRLSPVSVR